MILKAKIKSRHLATLPDQSEKFRFNIRSKGTRSIHNPHQIKLKTNENAKIFRRTTPPDPLPVNKWWFKKHRTQIYWRTSTTHVQRSQKNISSPPQTRFPHPFPFLAPPVLYLAPHVPFITPFKAALLTPPSSTWTELALYIYIIQFSSCLMDVGRSTRT